MGPKTRYIPGLDGLRAISIVMVIITHLGLANHLPQTSFWLDRVLALCSGATGVRVFFVISGFLINFLLLREYQENGKINLLQFYLRRILRLFPALLLLLLANLGLMIVGVFPTSYFGLLLSLFYLINFAPLIYIPNSLSHIWSLAVEEQFYLIWPAILAWLRPVIATYFAFFLVFVSATLFVWPLDFILDVQSPWLSRILQITSTDPNRYSHFFTEGRYFQISKAFYLERWLLPAMGSILIGCLFALANQRIKRNWLPRLPWSFAIVGILFFSPLVSPIHLLPLITLVQAVGVGLLVYIIFKNPELTIVRLLEWAPLREMGRISYGLYLWQGLFLTTGPGSSIWFQQFPQNILLTFVVSVLCFRYFEQPFLNLKERMRRT